MPFDLADLLAARRGQGYELQSQYVNAQVPKMLRLSPNVRAIPQVRFDPERASTFQIRRQPHAWIN